ncbi:unnamed protein product [Sphenostylis stenocarpa]|uniref:MADS-box domain-containing protein n=1 Tax=Sphenostylis stenocarpa TaxID=92480 RepID=A0AA86S867_9FABA|nr:unnamed protein product [Sphenostylis stenocarpa]
MGRGRIPMDLIEKEKARKTTFQKRKTGLIKKVYEFSTLCSVDVGVIIFASKRPKVYDVEEYFSERMKRIEGEISKVQKEKIQIMYPTWDDSYNVLEEEQLRMFLSILDAKLNACNQRMNMLKRESKEKTITDKDDLLVPSVAQHSHHNFMQNVSQTQIFPLNDNSQVPFYPCHPSQSSLSSLFHFGQNCTQLIEKNTMVDWGHQVALFVVLPMVLCRKPDALITVLPTLRENTKASIGDLSIGLYAWSRNLLPIVIGKSGNPQSRDLVLQLMEKILSTPKARPVLVHSAVRKGERLIPPPAFEILLRVTFPPSSTRVKATERFEAIYAILKEVVLEVLLEVKQ